MLRQWTMLRYRLGLSKSDSFRTCLLLFLGCVAIFLLVTDDNSAPGEAPYRAHRGAYYEHQERQRQNGLLERKQHQIEDLFVRMEQDFHKRERLGQELLGEHGARGERDQHAGAELRALEERDRESHNPPTCSPTSHIMFLKTHKCASTTLQNIFFRYGYNHDLMFAMPKKGHYLGNPYPFKSRMVPPIMRPPGGKLDILALHSRLNVPEMAKVLHPDTIYITAVRDPAELFESLYNYFNMSGSYGLTLTEFLSQPMEEQKKVPRYYKRFGYNMMLFDLGLDIQLNLTDDLVQEKIQYADKLFKTVLVSEKLDEGLILMKELLCWEFKDIVAFTKNARRSDTRPVIGKVQHDQLRELNREDYMLYEHFLSKHEKAVEKYGKEKMAKQVEKLAEYRKAIFKDCRVHIVHSYGDSENGVKDGNMFKEYSYQVYNYLVDKVTASDECLLLTLPELAATEIVRNKTIKLLQKAKLM